MPGDAQSAADKPDPTSIPIHINNTMYRADKEIMTGLEIKHLAKLGDGDRLFQIVPGGDPKPIANDESITLHPGMHFRSMVDGSLG